MGQRAKQEPNTVELWVISGLASVQGFPFFKQEPCLHPSGSVYKDGDSCPASEVNGSTLALCITVQNQAVPIKRHLVPI